MKVRSVEGVATHNDPESCVGAGNCDGEALTGERAGWVLSREMEIHTGVPTLWRKAEGDIQPRRQREAGWNPARSETPRMLGSTATGNREIPWSPVVRSAAGRVGKSMDTRR